MKEKKWGEENHHKPHQELSSTQPEDSTWSGIINSTSSWRAALGLCLGRRDSYFAPTACVQRVISLFLWLSPRFSPGDQSPGLFLSGWQDMEPCITGLGPSSAPRQQRASSLPDLLSTSCFSARRKRDGRGCGWLTFYPSARAGAFLQHTGGFVVSMICCPVVPSSLGAINTSRACAVLTNSLKGRA